MGVGTTWPGSNALSAAARTRRQTPLDIPRSARDLCELPAPRMAPHQASCTRAHLADRALGNRRPATPIRGSDLGTLDRVTAGAGRFAVRHCYRRVPCTAEC